MTEEPPRDPDERIEWIAERAGEVDDFKVEDEPWIEDKVVELWNKRGTDNFPDQPDCASDADWFLFRMAVQFGMDYEYYNPR